MDRASPSIPDGRLARPSITAAVVDFADALRQAGLPLSMVEVLDAVQALGHVEALDRAVFKATLRATLVKRAEHRVTFDELFDLFFAVRRGVPPALHEAERAGPEAAGEDLAADREDGGEGNLLAALVDALRRRDQRALRALAARAVEQHGGITAQRASSASYYLYRTLRQLDLDNLYRRVLRAERERHRAEAQGVSDPATEFDERLLREESARGIEELRRLIAEAIRQRLAEVKGSQEAVAAYRQPPIEDVDFLGASPTHLRQLRQALQPLARKLAARVERRRQKRRRRGHLDFRRTMRRAVPTGGVPLDPVFRRPHVSRPNLVVLCDLSGSVAEFAEFTMGLLHAMSEEFSRIRFFAFVDGVDEVTRLIEESRDQLDSHHLLASARLVWADGHSDYGNVFRRFRDLYARDVLSPKATVIITGDARNNYHEPATDALRSIRERSRRVYWLNPEPRAEWNTTDSIMDTYARYCHGVFEVRTLRQLEAFVGAIA